MRWPVGLTSILCLIFTAGILGSLLPAASCVPVEYPVKETYYETILVTENRTENYNETVPVVKTVSGEEALTPYVVWSNPSLKFKGNRFIWYYGYRLPDTGTHTGEKIRIVLYKQDYYEYAVISLFDMAPRGQVLQPPIIAISDPLQPPSVDWTWITKEGDTTTIGNWLNMANIKFNFAHFLGGQSDLWLNRESAYSYRIRYTRSARYRGRDSCAYPPAECQVFRFLYMDRQRHGERYPDDGTPGSLPGGTGGGEAEDSL